MPARNRHKECARRERRVREALRAITHHCNRTSPSGEAHGAYVEDQAFAYSCPKCWLMRHHDRSSSDE